MVAKFFLGSLSGKVFNTCGVEGVGGESGGVGGSQDWLTMLLPNGNWVDLATPQVSQPRS